MKKYIFLVKQVSRKEKITSVIAAFDSIEKAESYRSSFYCDSDVDYIGFIEMIELR